MRRRILIILAIMMWGIGSVYYTHASSFKLNAMADKTEVNLGEAIIIDLTLSDIDMGENGINVVEGYLEYEDSFFSNMELINQNNWEVTYNKDEGKFLTLKMIDGIKNEENILRMKLKVREEVEAEETEIKIKDIISNDGNNLINEVDKTIKIKIKKQTSDEKDEKDKEDNKLEESSDKEEKEDAIEYDVEKEISSEKQQTVVSQNAKTGDNIIFVVLGIIVLIVINLIIFKIYIKNDKDIKKK